MTVSLVRPGILYAWKGPSLLIVNDRGEAGSGEPLAGFYFREARFLHTLRLLVNGKPPWLCECAALSPESLALTFVHPEITQPGGGGTGQSGDEEEKDERGIPVRALDLRVRYQVGAADLTIDLEVANRTRQPLRAEITWELGADFADIQEAQAPRREQDAAVETVQSDGHLAFVYRHPQLPFRTEVRPSAGFSAHAHQLSAVFLLSPQQTERSSLLVVPIDARGGLTADAVAHRDAVLRQWRFSFTQVEIPGNTLLERVLVSNVRDIAAFPLLEGEPDEWLAMQAGMPLYPAFFGRDALTAGWQAGYLDRGEALDAALTKLGRLQSNRVDDWRDEQPGRIPYQVRQGPLALLNLNPYSAYYADFASPLMFVISLANLWAWTGERRAIEKHWDVARRILDWARVSGDPDKDGYLEYQTRSSKGTKNQGWKDSGDAIVYDDGSPVAPPIATCELQGYWYIAQEVMAVLSWVMGARDDAAEYRKSASALKERFNRDWWVDRESFFALALDPDKRQVGAITSNVGHCLACGIIDRERLPRVVDRMFAADMFSGWGIRTLSSNHAFYNPLSYHRGTVWAVEQATTAFGLRRFGFDARAVDLAEGLFSLAQLYPEFRIPECIGGYARAEGEPPGAYPRANTPQLWNATAFPLLVQTLLGIVPLAAANTLILDPVLPAWLPEVIVRDLRVGEATVTLRFVRSGNGRSEWDVVRKAGTLHVLRQPAPESLGTTWADRTGALIESLLK